MGEVKEGCWFSLFGKKKRNLLNFHSDTLWPAQAKCLQETNLLGQYALEHSFQQMKVDHVEIQTLLLFILILTRELHIYKMIVTRP
jgi:hypothetical protein